MKGKTKLLVLLFLGMILLMPFLSIEPVKAQSVQMYFGGGTDSSAYNLRDEHPSDVAYASAYGAVFNATYPGYVNSITMAMAKIGSPQGLLKVALSGYTGSFEDGTAYPTGELIEISSTEFNCLSLSTSLTYRTFQFSATYWMDVGDTVAIIIFAPEGDGMVSTASYPRWFASSSGSKSQSIFQYISGGWEDLGRTASFSLNVYGIDAPAPTPTPVPTPPITPAPTPAPTPEPIQISGLMNWIIWAIIISGFGVFAFVVAHAKLKLGAK